MIRLLSRRRRVERQLRQLVATHHVAIYHGLIHSEPGSIEEQIAEFLLEQCGWSLTDFLIQFQEGRFCV